MGLRGERTGPEAARNRGLRIDSVGAGRCHGGSGGVGAPEEGESPGRGSRPGERGVRERGSLSRANVRSGSGRFRSPHAHPCGRRGLRFACSRPSKWAFAWDPRGGKQEAGAHGVPAEWAHRSGALAPVKSAAGEGLSLPQRCGLEAEATVSGPCTHPRSNGGSDDAFAVGQREGLGHGLFLGWGPERAPSGCTPSMQRPCRHFETEKC